MYLLSDTLMDALMSDSIAEEYTVTQIARNLYLMNFFAQNQKVVLFTPI